MFNQKSKTIKNIPSKEEGVKLIGRTINGKTVTNIESNGQIRVINDGNPSQKQIDKWKKKYMKSGLQFHEGQLLQEHDSQEIYEKFEEINA